MRTSVKMCWMLDISARLFPSRTVGRVQLPPLIKGRHLILGTWLTRTLPVCDCVCVCACARQFEVADLWITLDDQTSPRELHGCISFCQYFITSQLTSAILQARDQSAEQSNTGKLPLHSPCFLSKHSEAGRGSRWPGNAGKRWQSCVFFLSVVLAQFDGCWRRLAKQQQQVGSNEYGRMSPCLLLQGLDSGNHIQIGIGGGIKRNSAIIPYDLMAFFSLLKFM